MRDLGRYWQEVRTLAESLPKDVWLVSEEGALVEVGSTVAARLLHAKSHRRASVDEIWAHRSAEAEKLRDATRERRRKRGVEVVAIP